MKQLFLIFATLLTAALAKGQVPNSWMQKADLTGIRSDAVGFSIGSKGYIGTGYNFQGVTKILYKDFWEYDPDADTWTQKADFGGTARLQAIGFSIGSKGYLGIGWDGGYKRDFFEYDPELNTWKPIAKFGGGGRSRAVGFSIGNKGYLGMGDGGGNEYKDFWEYDPDANIWTQKADFGGIFRFQAIGFSIDTKGYLGAGSIGGPNTLKDFWEYDPDADTWTQIADFVNEHSSTVGFSIGTKGYVGIGANYKEFWEYDPGVNTWTRKADFGGAARYGAVAFSIGNKGYLGTGYSGGWLNDFWEYTSEICNGGSTVYADADDDGYGDTANSLFVADCIAPSGYVFDNTDCNDDPNQSGAFINPGATEVANVIDDNCNGLIDEGTCPLPANLSVVNITGTSAKLKWDAVAGGVGYKVRYKVDNTSEWQYRSASGNSKPITGLSSNTVYKWEVKTFCHIVPNVSSDWSPKQEFTTGSLRMGMEQALSFDLYPNPAKDHAAIQFTLPQSSHLIIKVYDVSGKEFVTILDDDVEQGDHSLLLNTHQFSKGVYLVKIISDSGIENQKLTVQ